MIIKSVKIDYGVLDDTISKDNLTVVDTYTSNFVKDKNTLITQKKEKLASLEKNFFLLDGSHFFPEESKIYNIGWESKSIADANGNINVYVEYSFTNAHSSLGLQVYFFEGCIPQSFAIEYYLNGTKKATTEKTGLDNTSFIDLTFVDSWNKIRLVFKKVNPYQRARFSSIVFGINYEITDDMIISVNAKKNIDISADYSSSGNFGCSFFNDGFFQMKDNKDLPINLKENLKAKIYIKKDNDEDFTFFGEYYTDETKVEEKGYVITLTGNDLLFKLGEKNYKNGIVYKNRSLADWARDVAQDAQIDIEIDKSFESIYSDGYITELPHREAFRLIAEAGTGALSINNDGKLVIKKVVHPDVSTLIENDDIVEGSLNSESKSELGVEVSKYSFSKAKEASDLSYLESVALTPEEQEIELVYAQFPVDVSSVKVFFDTTTSVVENVSKRKVYSDRILLYVTGNEGDSTWVTITGVPYNKSAVSVKRGSELKDIKKIENNFLLTGSLAEQVADYQYSILGKSYHSVEVVTNNNIELEESILLNNSSITIEEIQFDISNNENAIYIRGSEK